MPPQAKPALTEILGRDFSAGLAKIEICDIGARAEGTERFAGLVERGLANVTGFEPLTDDLAKLNSKRDPRRRYVSFIFGNGQPATFHSTNYPGCSSLYRPDPNVIDLFDGMGASDPASNFAVVSAQPVPTGRLDDLANLPRFDYMKLDIQGGELEALRGATSSLAKATVLEVEVEFIALYEGQPLFGDVQVFLRERGFVLHKLVDVVGRAIRPFQMTPINTPMSQILSADAIFVRDFSNFDRWSDEQLLKAAAVLYEAYNSHDLAHLLLQAYDRRKSTKFAAVFRAFAAQNPELPMLCLNIKREED